MKHELKKREAGSIKWILIIVVALVLASYFFNFSVKDAVENEQTQENFGYISENVATLWTEHLSQPANYLWNEVFLGVIWSAFTTNMTKLQNGENTIFEDFAPSIEGIGSVAEEEDENQSADTVD